MTYCHPNECPVQNEAEQVPQNQLVFLQGFHYINAQKENFNMICIISPSKTLDFNCIPHPRYTIPVFSSQTQVGLARDRRRPFCPAGLKHRNCGQAPQTVCAF